MAALLDLPKIISLPALAATAAYINAKTGLSWDVWALYNLFGQYLIPMRRAEKKDRLNVFYVFEDLAKNPKTAGRTFLIIPKDESDPDQKTEWTYAEAYEIVLKHAAWLKNEQHVQKSEIIAMNFKNGPQFIWIWFALWSLGAVPAFMNYNLRDQAFIHSVTVSTARLLLVGSPLKDCLTDEVLQSFKPDRKGRTVDAVVLNADIQQHIQAQTPYRAPDEVRSGLTLTTSAMLIYTSGTTGLPKAATVQWAKPWAGFKLYSNLIGLKKDDRYLTALPLYHSSGSILGVLQPLEAGAAVVVLPSFSPRTFMRHVHETKATGIHYIGEMCRYLVAAPPTPYDQAHNVRFAFGNGMRPDVWQKFKDRFNIPTIVEFYGATEAPGSSYVHSRNSFLRGAIGRQGALLKMLPGQLLVKHDMNTDMPYRDPKTGFCVKCAFDEPGEALVVLDANDIQAKYIGYFGNDQASDSKVLRDVLKKGDCYYRTGDLQKRDSEGRLWFVDRVGDTFRWKSENVSTLEVSQAMGEHPIVSEANVYGVEVPNFDGRAGCAAIVLAGEQKMDDNLARDLAAHAKQKLPLYAVPLFLRLMKTVEITGTLKHQKVQLRKQGADPEHVGEDEMYWLERGADKYVKLGERDWKRIVGGEAKL